MKILDFLKRKQQSKHISEKTSKPSSQLDYLKPVNIQIFQEETFTKIIVEDYYTIQEYVSKMQEIDDIEIDKLLNNSVVWNSDKQKVNKGTYFVFKHNNNLYNILIQDNTIKLDERIPVGEETSNKVYTFNEEDYRFFRCIHDKNGSTYSCGYYNPKGSQILGILRDDFLRDFECTIQTLSSFGGIDNIINLENIRNSILKTVCNEDVNEQ